MTNALPSSAVAARVPLIVDLDGTLVATDTLWELIIAFLKANPLHIFSLIVWLFSGKAAAFKQRITSAATLDVTCLPYRADCLAWLQEEKQAGRKMYLATGADLRLATAVAAHLCIFDGIIASDGRTNATGANKFDLIAQALAGQNFEYVGNAMIDIEVWRKSLTAIVVAPDRGVIAELNRQSISITRLFHAPKSGFRTWLRALRAHQWVKNMLVFTPLLTSHRIFDWVGLRSAACGFLAFSLVASSTYLINDLLDLPADRLHPSKRARPLAQGSISIPAAIVAIFVLLALAAAVSSFLPLSAAFLLTGYAAATLWYSAYLKKLLIADVVALALFYTARLLYGGLVTGIEISIWTLAFCGFSFFSLAAVKRINDLAKAIHDQSDSLRHRAYQAQDLNALVGLASATCGTAVLVLIFYINSQQGELLYRHPKVLWTLCIPLLYWFGRIVTLGNRGALADDPILFATKDRATYVVLALMAVITIVAS